MLSIFNYNVTSFTGNGLAVLDKAKNVAVTENLQQPHVISFEYPNDSRDENKAQYIAVNNIVVCEGQAYRINNVTKDSNNNQSVYRVEGTRLFFADAERKHITGISDTMNVAPYEIIKAAFAGTGFTLIPNEKLPNGMKWIGTSGVAIDFFGMDKTNPYAVCEAVIGAYGKGEIYVDNKSFAVVERIGTDNGVRLTLDKNLDNLSVQRQTTELCTVLYPYGKNDLTIDQAEIQDEGQPKEYYGLPYVVSDEGIRNYGIIEGYKDYSEYDDPTKLYKAALWDLMGDGNEYRLDTPQITITGDMIDLSKLSDYGDLEKISLGDTVHVFDEDGTEYVKRVINITYYPYSSQPPRVTIGSPSNTNLFYTQWQQGKLFKTLQKNSTTGTAKIIASYFNGNVDSSSNPIKSGDGSFMLANSLITIYDKQTQKKLRALIGLNNNTFVFDLYDASGKEIISTDTGGNLSAEFAALTVGGVDIGAKLVNLQQQIDEITGGTI